MKRALILYTITSITGVLFAAGVFPKKEAEVAPGYHDQYIVIEYDGSEEILHILMNVETDSSSLAWIVPLPSAPIQIGFDTSELFWEIGLMCQPEKVIYNFVCYSSISPASYVKTHEQHGHITHHATVEAELPDTLFIWLENKGYCIKDSVYADSVFADYIARDWVFVMLEIDSLPDREVSVQPVAFHFSTTEIIYPALITSLISVSRINWITHVIACNRVEVDGGKWHVDYEYGNRLSETEYQAVQDNYPLVAEICNEGDFITRLHNYFYRPGNVESDYVFVPMEEDNETMCGEGLVNAIIFPILPVGFIFVVTLRRRLRRRRKR